MKKRTMLSLLAIPLAGAGVVGSAALAAHNVPATIQAQPVSVVSDQETPDTDKEIPDAVEQKQLEAQAVLSPAEAQQIAETQLQGNATSVQIEDEDRSVVYSVIINDQEVKVDATNGSIVKIETNDQETADDGNELTTGHGNEPNDGLSVSDGDGETNDDN